MKQKTKNNNNIWDLLIIFQIILVIKIFISLAIDGTFIYPDEVCIIRKAIYFGEHLNFFIPSCMDIIKFPAGEPMPFLSYLLAPIYTLIHDSNLNFVAALSLNSLLISSLLFPFFWFTEKITKNTKLSYFISGLLCFAPSVIAYEKTLMTESTYLCIFIWSTFLYAKAFDSKKPSVKHKIAALVLGICGALTRPFGFILPLAIMANEVFQAKRKKLIIIAFLLTIILALGLIYLTFGSRFFESLVNNRLATILDPSMWPQIFKAITQQLNSLFIATFFMPFILFTHFLTSKHKELSLQKVKPYFITYLFLNLAISGQHLYGYYLEGKDPLLIMRYIQTSIIMVLLIGIASLFSKPKLKKNNLVLITSVLTILCLLTFKDLPAKFSFNLEFLLYYLPHITIEADLRASREILKYTLIPFCVIFYLLYSYKKDKILIGIISILFIFQSSYTYNFLANHQVKASFTEKIQNLNGQNVSMIIEEDLNTYKGIIMKIYAETTKDLAVYMTKAPIGSDIDISSYNKSEDFKNSHILLSSYKIPDLKIISTIAIPNGNIKIYLYEK